MTRGGRRKRWANALRALQAAVLDSPGDASPALRKAVAARAAAAGSGAGGEGGEAVPGVLAGYVDKVAHHAYKTTEEDIAALRAAGYSEDALFELTVSAALGAGMARLVRGLDAVRRARPRRRGMRRCV